MGPLEPALARQARPLRPVRALAVPMSAAPPSSSCAPRGGAACACACGPGRDGKSGRLVEVSAASRLLRASVGVVSTDVSALPFVSSAVCYLLALCTFSPPRMINVMFLGKSLRNRMTTFLTPTADAGTWEPLESVYLSRPTHPPRGAHPNRPALPCL